LSRQRDTVLDSRHRHDILTRRFSLENDKTLGDDRHTGSGCTRYRRGCRTRHVQRTRGLQSLHSRTSPALAELKKDPSRSRAAAFAEQRKPIGQYLQRYAGIKEELKKYPNCFVNLAVTTPGGQHKNRPAK
jgi:hypothetical protein